MRAALAGAATAALLIVGLAAPAAASPPPACDEVRADDPPSGAEARSAPLDLLHVRRAQEVLDRLGAPPGKGVNVAVLDSGVRARPGVLDVVHRVSFTGRRDVIDPHGTAVAGVIAARPRHRGTPVGIAPDAGIVDVRVYDTSVDDGDPATTEVDAARVAEGLDWVAANARRWRIGVANVSLAVHPDPRLEAAVERAWRAGVVVVAASGNRPQAGQPFSSEFASTPAPGEDAAGKIFPAGYPHVVAVNATADGTSAAASEYVLDNSDTDLAAPTYGLVSVALNGGTCVIDQVATSWAAAEVSGTLALIRSRFGGTPAQAVARLVDTADGAYDTPTGLTGSGVIQPVEALTRPLEPAPGGRLQRVIPEQRAVPRATAPEPRSDLLAGTRSEAVWWGLLGGGALVVALLARPALARRRR